MCTVTNVGKMVHNSSLPSVSDLPTVVISSFTIIEEISLEWFGVRRAFIAMSQIGDLQSGPAKVSPYFVELF